MNTTNKMERNPDLDSGAASDEPVVRLRVAEGVVAVYDNTVSGADVAPAPAEVAEWLDRNT